MLSQRIASRLEPFVADVRRRQEPFYKRLKAHYNSEVTQNQIMIRRSKFFAAFYLWFMALTILFTSLRYTVPYVAGQVWGLDPWLVYWCKVVIGFGFVQITANWTCVRCYSSFYEVTEDQPDLRKSLWDDHPESKVAVGDSKKDDDDKTRDAGEGKVRRPGQWQYCAVCQRDAPPRAHHCKVCRKCTLKRDHHCFIVGACIGYYNQRYFVMLTFYLMVYSGVCLFLAYFYLRDHMWATSSQLDYFLPYTLYQWVVTGSLGVEHFLLLCQVYTFAWCGPMCASFFWLQIITISLGRTMHEFTHGSGIKVTSSVAENFRSVFGPFWLFNFLFPAVIIFRQAGDGIHWSKVYIVAKRRNGDLSEIKSRSQ